MAGAYHGLRYALSRGQAIELWIDSSTADDLAGRTVTVAVLRGIAQALPARADPWFRHKLRRGPLSAAAGESGLGPIRGTKLGFILRTVSAHPLAELAAVDLRRCGTRLALKSRPLDSFRSPVRSGDPAVVECAVGQFNIGLRTSGVMLIGLSENETGSTHAVQAAANALAALCGARAAGMRSLLIAPSDAGAVISVPITAEDKPDPSPAVSTRTL